MAYTVYKVMHTDEWAETIKSGSFTGSSDDRRDGFIHLSTATQLRETLDKHFAGIEGLVLLEVDARQFGSTLKWEPSRGGDLFPHLYAPLPLAAVAKSSILALGSDRRHVLPPEVPA